MEEETVNHPSHYNSLGARCLNCGHPIECIDVVERFGFNLGNAMKYVWRAGHKSSDPVVDLKKAAWYVAREIQKILGGKDNEKNKDVI